MRHLLTLAALHAAALTGAAAALAGEAAVIAGAATAQRARRDPSRRLLVTGVPVQSEGSGGWPSYPNPSR